MRNHRNIEHLLVLTISTDLNHQFAIEVGVLRVIKNSYHRKSVVKKKKKKTDKTMNNNFKWKQYPSETKKVAFLDTFYNTHIFFKGVKIHGPYRQMDFVQRWQDRFD